MDLPTPYFISAILITAGEHIYLSGCDLLQSFNLFLIPRFPIPLLIITHIRASLVNSYLPSQLVLTFLTSLPMGASLSPSHLQPVLLFVVYRTNFSGFPFSSSYHCLTLTVVHGVQLPYIDDLNYVGISVDGFNMSTRRITDPEAAGLPFETVRAY